MAHGWLRHYGNDSVQVYSAGIETHGVNPQAIAAMQRMGIDISNHTSDLTSRYTQETFDIIVTVCDNARENCPYFPGTGKRIHQPFPDPASARGSTAEIQSEFDSVCEQIRAWSQRLITDEIEKVAG